MRSFELFFLDLAKAVKAVNFYPKNHPSMTGILGKLSAEINEYAGADNFVLDIGRDSITARGEKITGTHPMIKELINAFMLRRVSRIYMHAGLEYGELFAFLQILTMEIGGVFAAGGVEAIIDKSPISHIALSETQMQRILQKPTQPEAEQILDQSTEEDEAEAEKQEKAEADEGMQEQQTQIRRDPVKSEKWMKLKAALEEADAVPNSGAFTRVLSDVREFLKILDWRDDGALVSDVMATLVLKAKSGKSDDIRREAGLFVTDSLTHDRMTAVLDAMISGLLSRTNMIALRPVWLFVEEAASELMLDRLGETHDIRARRMLITEIATLGEYTFQRVMFHLGDERWFVVRNMVTILGIFGRPASTDRLFEIALHHDNRVKKEVVKSLARISDPRVLPFFREMLHTESDDVKQLIVFCLGITRNKQAVDDLRIVLEGTDPGFIKKEALTALGRIGSREAFPLIKNFAAKRGFFTKSEDKDLRVAAVRALAEIRTSDSRELLEKLVKDSDHDVSDAAFEALQKVKHAAGG